MKTRTRARAVLTRAACTRFQTSAATHHPNGPEWLPF
jgi:hypothetical protein